MNNYMDSARTAYKSIPFISCALQTNGAGNYHPVLDEKIVSDRGAFFMAVSSANFAFIPTFSNLVLPYVINTNSSMAFTAVVAFSTPFAIAVGIVALGILGYKLDQLLTYRAATHAAIREFTNTNMTVSFEASQWLLDDIANVRKLLRNKNVNLEKKDCNDFSILARAVFKDIEIFSLLWNQSPAQIKYEVLIYCKNQCKNQLSTVHQKTLDFLIDNHKICSKEFTQKEHHHVLHCGWGGWTNDSFVWLKKMVDLGFSMDAKGETGKSIREEFSKDILDFAFDHPENQNMYYERNQSVLKKMKFLQSLGEPKISAVLTGEHKNDNSFLSKLPLELFQEISKEVKNSFAPKLEYQTSQLEAIAPFLAFNSLTCDPAAQDNVKIGNMIWERLNKEERIKLFIECFAHHANPKLAISLMESKKVSGKMFTERAQYSIFSNIFNKMSENRKDPESECLNKLVDLGFNINSKVRAGKETIREMIENGYINNQHMVEEQKTYYTKVLKIFDKAHERQMINLGLIIKPGFDENDALNPSDLKMFPNDILTHIMKILGATY